MFLAIHSNICYFTTQEYYRYNARKMILINILAWSIFPISFLRSEK